ncbi:hypothetical protein QE152_g276 [Popillia japonica]|uniref:Uncharacterized protein n=1 Tax=Popillia japonica TaxID=7064 RepID=A0AAW1NBL7_POPJA
MGKFNAQKGNSREQYFINRYATVRHLTRSNLYMGKFNAQKGNSREQYFINRYVTVRHLTTKLTEKEIIKHFARHYDFEIHKTVIVQNITTFKDFCEILRQYDDLYKQKNTTPAEHQRDNYTPYYLTKLTEKEIIKHFARHYDFEIHKTVIVQNITTFKDFCEILRQYDDLYKQKNTTPAEHQRDNYTPYYLRNFGPSYAVSNSKKSSYPHNFNTHHNFNRTNNRNFGPSYAVSNSKKSSYPHNFNTHHNFNRTNNYQQNASNHTNHNLNYQQNSCNNSNTYNRNYQQNSYSTYNRNYQQNSYSPQNFNRYPQQNSNQNHYKNRHFQSSNQNFNPQRNFKEGNDRNSQQRKTEILNNGMHMTIHVI